MFALILWVKTKDRSVVRSEDIRTGRDAITKAKWGDKWYEAQIIKTGDSKDFLESLSVTTNGEILTPEKRTSVPAELLLAKREHQAKEKKDKALKRRTIMTNNKSLLKDTPIFAPPLLPNETDSDAFDSDRESTASLKESPPRSPQYGPDEEIEEEMEDSESEKSESESESISEDRKDDQFSGTEVEASDAKKNEPSISKSEEKPPCFCAKLQIAEEDVETFNTVMQLIKSMKVSKDLDNAATTKEIDKVDLEELMPNSKVFVSKSIVERTQLHYQKQPKELVRRLMRMILGDKLKMLSATGRRWPRIPTNIYDAVFDYINKKAKKSRYKISEQEYRSVLTQLCATERNSKNKKQNSKTKLLKSNEKTKNENFRAINKNHEEEKIEKEKVEQDNRVNGSNNQDEVRTNKSEEIIIEKSEIKHVESVEASKDYSQEKKKEADKGEEKNETARIDEKNNKYSKVELKKKHDAKDDQQRGTEKNEDVQERKTKNKQSIDKIQAQEDKLDKLANKKIMLEQEYHSKLQALEKEKISTEEESHVETMPIKRKRKTKSKNDVTKKSRL